MKKFFVRYGCLISLFLSILLFAFVLCEYGSVLEEIGSIELWDDSMWASSYAGFLCPCFLISIRCLYDSLGACFERLKSFLKSDPQ